MITQEEAKRIAESFLDEYVRPQIPFEVVIVERAITEQNDHWVFPYNGRAYVESSDWNEALAGNNPVYVNRLDYSVGFLRVNKP